MSDFLSVIPQHFQVCWENVGKNIAYTEIKQLVEHVIDILFLQIQSAGFFFNLIPNRKRSTFMRLTNKS